MDERDLYSGLIHLRILHPAVRELVFGLAMTEEPARHGYRTRAGTLYPTLHGLKRNGYPGSTQQNDGKSRQKACKAMAPGRPLNSWLSGLRKLIFIALTILCAASAWAGPPFQTDDPEPIEFRHYEFYTFASSDGTPLETDTLGPAVEFNWGALPNVHLHIVLPAAAIFPRDDARAFGLGDIETGIKYRFVQESKARPMIGTFVMLELPAGNADRGLGIGKTWFKLPIWIQKSWGPWTSYGGGGEVVYSGKVPGYRNYPFAGWLVQRDLGKKWTLGTEAFFHGPEGDAAPQTRASTLVDFGGYYKFHGDERYQLLFSYGHSVAGQTENYAYLGLYWTWGKRNDKDRDQTSRLRLSQTMLGPPDLHSAF